MCGVFIMELLKNYYVLLDIPENADQNEIKKSFRKLSMKHHPDKGGDSNKFAEINEAYEVLGQPDKRRIYDTQQRIMNMPTMNTPIDPNDLMNTFMKSMSEGSEDVFSQDSEPNIINIFKHVFGNQTAPVNKRATTKPPVLMKTIEVSLTQAYNGCTVPVHVERWIENNETFRKCLEEETLYVDIPAGIDNNEILSIKGRGNVNRNDVSGDVKVYIQVVNDTKFTRAGLDLIYEKSITLKDALCGFHFEFEHINGKLFRINNDKGTTIQPGERKVIPGIGMRRGDKTGSMVIIFSIDFPKTLALGTIDELDKILTYINEHSS